MFDAYLTSDGVCVRTFCSFCFCWIHSRRCLCFFRQYEFRVCTALFSTRKEPQFLYLHKSLVSPHPCDTPLSSHQSSPWQWPCCAGWNITQLFLTLSYHKANTEMSLALRRSHCAGWEQRQCAGQVPAESRVGVKTIKRSFIFVFKAPSSEGERVT